MFDIKDYMTVGQVAARLGYTNANITRLIREGQLQALKRGRRYFILPEDVSDYVMEAELLKG